MSEKAIMRVIDGATDEDTELPVKMSVTADYMFTKNLYFTIDDRVIVVPVDQALAMADFIKREARVR